MLLREYICCFVSSTGLLGISVFHLWLWVTANFTLRFWSLLGSFGPALWGSKSSLKSFISIFTLFWAEEKVPPKDKLERWPKECNFWTMSLKTWGISLQYVATLQIGLKSSLGLWFEHPSIVSMLVHSSLLDISLNKDFVTESHNPLVPVSSFSIHCSSIFVAQCAGSGFADYLRQGRNCAFLRRCIFMLG